MWVGQVYYQILSRSIPENSVFTQKLRCSSKLPENFHPTIQMAPQTVPMLQSSMSPPSVLNRTMSVTYLSQTASSSWLKNPFAL